MTKWLKKLFRLSSKNHDSGGNGTAKGLDLILLIVLGILGITLMLMGSGKLSRQGDRVEPVASSSQQEVKTPATDYVSRLEHDLEQAIGQMKGIGAVSVVITLEADSRTIFATSTSDDTERIEERDSSGGVRTTHRAVVTTEPVVIRSSGGNEELVVVGVEPPKVNGVLVVAEGATTPETRLAIAQAVSAALGIALHRVAVVEREV